MNLCIHEPRQIYCLCKCIWGETVIKLSEAACNPRLLPIVEIHSRRSNSLASCDQCKQCCYYVLGVVAEHAMPISNVGIRHGGGSYGVGIDHVPCNWARWWAYDDFLLVTSKDLPFALPVIGRG
jgi:hypothetical protein